MLSREDNELLCRIGPGTPMGDLMRQYWMPALLVDELPEPGLPAAARAPAGREPHRLPRHLRQGRPHPERLPAPRRLAVLRPQRGRRPALRLPRLEVRRVRAPASTCRPSRPRATSRTRCARVAYPCVERNGIIWAYMGPRQTPPPLPDLEANMLAGRVRVIQVSSASATGCRRSRATSTPATRCFLHLGVTSTPDDRRPARSTTTRSADRAPRYEVVDTEFGTSYGAYRPAEADSYYWRIAHFLFPFYAMIPTGVLGCEIRVRAWVPMDDEHTCLARITINRRPAPGAATGTRGGQVAGAPLRVRCRTRPTGTGASGWRRNQDNDYLIDREEQKQHQLHRHRRASSCRTRP